MFLFKALVNWCKVLTVHIISDWCLSWAAEPEVAILEIAVINSSLPTCFSSSCNFFESFALLYSSVAWIFGFGFTQNFCFHLCAASFCFRSALYFLSVASLGVIFLWSLCESFPRSHFQYKPTIISFSMLFSRVWSCSICGRRKCCCWGLRIGFLVYSHAFSCFLTFSWEWLICLFLFFFAGQLLTKNWSF